MIINATRVTDAESPHAGVTLILIENVTRVIDAQSVHVKGI